MLTPAGRVTGEPAAIEAATVAIIAGSTAITRASGQSALTAVATPEISPPPPTGTTTCVTSSTCSHSSRPTVPCPAITARSLNGCTITRPVAVASASMRANASVASAASRSAVPP